MNLSDFESKFEGKKNCSTVMQYLNSKDNHGKPHVSIRKLEHSLIKSNAYEKWFEQKIKEIMRTDSTGVSSILGEMRTLGYLDDLFPRSLVPRNGPGHDFDANYHGHEFVIEVNTQLGAQKNTIIEHQESKHILPNGGAVAFKVTEKASYGFPRRDNDNIQGEAVSKIAAIKQLEHQLDQDKINILWIDYMDPLSWILPFSNQTTPIQNFNSIYTSGAIWWAIYGCQGDKIYDELNLEFGFDKFYEMEFDGKLHGASKINFVITAFPEKTVLFQNPTRHTPDSAIIELMNVNSFSYADSWMNFPVQDLADRIEAKRSESKLLIEKVNNYKDDL